METGLFVPGTIAIFNVKVKNNSGSYVLAYDEDNPNEPLLLHRLSNEKFLGIVGDLAEYRDLHIPKKLYYNNIPKLELLSWEDKFYIGNSQPVLQTVEENSLFTINLKKDSSHNHLRPSYFGVGLDSDDNMVILLLIPPGYNAVSLANGNSIETITEWVARTSGNWVVPNFIADDMQMAGFNNGVTPYIDQNTWNGNIQEPSQNNNIDNSSVYEQHDNYSYGGGGTSGGTGSGGYSGVDVSSLVGDKDIPPLVLNDFTQTAYMDGVLVVQEENTVDPGNQPPTITPRSDWGMDIYRPDINPYTDLVNPNRPSDEEDEGYFNYLAENFTTFLVDEPIFNSSNEATASDYYKFVKVVVSPSIIPQEDPSNYGEWDDETKLEIKSINIVNLGYRTSDNPYRNLDKYLVRDEGLVKKYVSPFYGGIFDDSSESYLSTDKSLNLCQLEKEEGENYYPYSYRSTYRKGQIVKWNDEYWISLVDNNTRSLPAISKNWKKVLGNIKEGDYVPVTLITGNREEKILGRVVKYVRGFALEIYPADTAELDSRPKYLNGTLLSSAQVSRNNISGMLEKGFYLYSKTAGEDIRKLIYKGMVNIVKIK